MKLADVIAEIARTSSSNWPILLDTILTPTASSGTQSFEHSPACLRIIPIDCETILCVCAERIFLWIA